MDCDDIRQKNCTIESWQMQTGPCRYELTIAPVSGKAIPVYCGETLRIAQTRGELCVDFNCFNLHNYKERMSVGQTRAQGFRVRQGHLVLSTPPRRRPMMSIAYMAESCVTDLLAARCDATMGEREFNLVPRTNCQDTFSEAVREYGLSPDDVHDSRISGCIRAGEKASASSPTWRRPATMLIF